jgi:hypothetical protein
MQAQADSRVLYDARSLRAAAHRAELSQVTTHLAGLDGARSARFGLDDLRGGAPPAGNLLAVSDAYGVLAAPGAGGAWRFRACARAVRRAAQPRHLFASPSLRRRGLVRAERAARRRERRARRNGQ